MLLGFVFSFLYSASAKTNPDWVQNYKKIYPDSEYLAQRGSGDSAEKSKTDATSALVRYLKSNVNANLSATMTSVSNGNVVDEKTSVVDDVSVKSEIELFGLEYTEPYYLKENGKWYCVAYLNRSNAWNQYKPQIEVSKNTFSLFYKNAEKETDSFARLSLYKKAWEQGKILLQKLEYGRIINPKEESAYQNERDEISKIPADFESSKQKCAVFISVENDYNKIMQTALSSVLSKNGFLVVKNKSEANYTAKIQIDNNVFGENPFSIKPNLDLKIISEEKRTVFSYEAEAEQKFLGYTMESAQKKSFPKLAKQMEDDVGKSLGEISKL